MRPPRRYLWCTDCRRRVWVDKPLVGQLHYCPRWRRIARTWWWGE